MAVDNSSIYKYQGQVITFKQNEIKDGPTKYYIGNFTAGSEPDKDKIIKLEQSLTTDKPERPAYTIKHEKFFNTSEIKNPATLVNINTFKINEDHQLIIKKDDRYDAMDVPLGKYYIILNDIKYDNCYIEVIKGEEIPVYRPVFVIWEDDDYTPVLLTKKK